MRLDWNWYWPARTPINRPSSPPLKKAIELLDVATKTMVVADDHFPSRLLRGEMMRSTPREVSESGRSHNTSTIDLRARRTCGSCRWFGRAITTLDLVELQQILDVGENVGDLETLGDRACLRPIVVAQRHELGAFDLRQDGKMRQLRIAPRRRARANRVLRGFGVLALTGDSANRRSRIIGL